MTEKLKQNAEQYGVSEGSPVGVQWAVQWVILKFIGLLQFDINTRLYRPNCLSISARRAAML